MTSWIVNAINRDLLEQALTEASRRLLNNALGLPAPVEDDKNLRFMAESLELAAIDMIDDENNLNDLRKVSADAFQLLRVISCPESPIEAAKVYLRMACLGIIGERGVDAARLLKELPWPTLPVNSQSWGVRAYATILEAWLLIIRKSGWQDLDEVQAKIVSLRKHQKNFEAKYLEGKASSGRTAAWELVALYHLSKAAEILAIFTTQGQVDGHFDIRQQLEAQFDRALIACVRAQLVELENISRLLNRTAQQLVDNCIWTVTRAVNSRVSKFVSHLVSKKQPKPIFEMLPPQRRTLREAGLLGSGHRAVVVNLPTSSGKTLIAEFRILQALNQFDHEKGWVAYLAPTRALVSQVCMRIRRDFAHLGINVERVSPALEVDGMEASLLTDRGDTTRFRVLVTTPEKLDLMLRGGWEEKIGRPLTLVVVDEAHNIGQKERGIKLELLLATINRECRYAQFLLLTPFIDNAAEIARWLSPDSHSDIGLSLNWHPNDRAIVLSCPRRGRKQGLFSLELGTIHTSKQTLSIPEIISLKVERPLGLSWSAIKNNASKLAAATAQTIKERGSVIVLARTIPNTWSLADNFKHSDNKLTTVHEDVSLVQRHLEREFGTGFPLCELLEYGVGVHHSGLSDEARSLIEWLFENEHIKILVATTTIAQGVNFPVAGVVMAAHQYPGPPPIDMPPEDFWNIAGRAGRIDHGSVGIVAMAAINSIKAAKLKKFVGRQVISLNSTLIDMMHKVMNTGGQLELHRLFYLPEWSAFLQYLAHTYRQIGDPYRFANEVEQVLRGTLGFQFLRRNRSDWANRLVTSVQAYGERISGKSLKLVDSTGFSWETVSITLKQLSDKQITEDVWDVDRLFSTDGKNLQKLMGILLSVPELRENLAAATGGYGPDGNRLALIVRDWVNGVGLPAIAKEYFITKPNGTKVDYTTALANCCKSLFGKLTQTASWGLAALQTMTFGEKFDNLPETEQQILRNLPARVFYGVNTNDAIALRLLGVPRGAAQPLAKKLGTTVSLPLPQLRTELSKTDAKIWVQAMGKSGADYFKIWKIFEGLN
jgi:superfamily II DNA/RNA helicase